MDLSYHLDKTQVPMGRVVASIEIQSIIDNDYFFYSFILKKNIKNTDNCIKRFRELCDELKDVFPKLTIVCNGDISQKCLSLEKDQQIELLCSKIELAIKDENAPMNEKCTFVTAKCILLEGACSNNFNKLCNELLNSCYKRERDIIASVILERALRRDLSSLDMCLEKIRHYCVSLGKESDELMSKCLLWTITCEELVEKAQGRDINLKSEIEQLTKKNLLNKRNIYDNNMLKDKCHWLLPECNFYVPNYANNNENIAKMSEMENLCDELQKLCKSLEVVYIPPSDLFNPMEKEVLLADALDIPQLYDRAKAAGILIEKHSSDFTFQRVLAFLVNSSSDIMDKCLNILRNNCSSIEYLDKSYERKCLNYKQNNKDVIDCVILGSESKRACRNLYNDIRKHLTEHYVTKVGLEHNWYDLPVMDDDNCKELLSLCFFYENTCEQNYEAKTNCDSLRNACYRQGRIDASLTFFEDILRGTLYRYKKTANPSCVTKLIEFCRDPKNLRKEDHFELCLSPQKTCYDVAYVLYYRCKWLKKQIESKYLQVTLEKCNILVPECDKMIIDYPSLNSYCTRLHQKCKLLREVKQLKDHMLKEGEDHLKGHRSCVNRLNEMCTIWTESNTIFSDPCKDKHNTCTSIMSFMSKHCYQFKVNLMKYRIGSNITKNITSEDCNLWEPYCSMLKKNCYSQNLQQYCEPLSKACAKYRTLAELEQEQCRNVLKELTKNAQAVRGKNSVFNEERNKAISIFKQVLGSSTALTNPALKSNQNSQAQNKLTYGATFSAVGKVLESQAMVGYECVRFSNISISDKCDNEIQNTYREIEAICENISKLGQQLLFPENVAEPVTSYIDVVKVETSVSVKIEVRTEVSIQNVTQTVFTPSISIQNITQTVFTPSISIVEVPVTVNESCVTIVQGSGIYTSTSIITHTENTTITHIENTTVTYIEETTLTQTEKATMEETRTITQTTVLTIETYSSFTDTSETSETPKASETSEYWTTTTYTSPTNELFINHASSSFILDHKKLFFLSLLFLVSI
ncbi:hypothetical protein PMAC_001744 [Pneumocystis sp. 'macacae']|nr:hypothetical protein PMAC_001744 [Pneumocystis sp. 'macacae']